MSISDPAPLGRSAAVVRDGRDVRDGGHLEPGRLERADGLLTAGAGALDEDLDLPHAVLHGPPRGAVRAHGSGVRRALPRALEAGHAGAPPGDGRPARIGDGDDGVVEGRLDVDVPRGHVLLLATPRLRDALPFGHARSDAPGLLLAPDADGLLGTATLPGIGLGALPADGQVAAMAETAIRADLLETLDVHRDPAPQVALHALLARDVDTGDACHSAPPSPGAACAWDCHR